MPPPPTRRFLRLSTTDALLFSVMVGCGEAYIGAFGIALGLTGVQVGLLASVPLLLGSIFQMLTPRGVRLLDSHKKWVIVCAVLQAAAFIPLMVMAATGRGSATVLFLAAGLYWGANLAGGPAWNTWIGTVVPRNIRSHYFAGRSRIAQLGVVVGLVATGLLLRSGDQDNRAAIFLIPFGVALIARLGCAFMHGAIAEPRPIPQPDGESPVRTLLSGEASASGGRLLLYMLCVQATCQIAAPYFTPFMLGERKFSYTTYAMILVASFMGKIIALPFWGRFAKRFGERTLLWIAGIGIIPLAAVWAVNDHPATLITLQLLAGFAWGAYELATFLLLFETIPARQRTRMLTLYNLLNACCVVVGASIGAFLLSHFGGGHRAYGIIFVVSSGARLLTLPLLARVHVPVLAFRTIFFRQMSVRPNAGADDRPILSSLEDSAK